ncbi:MULTISPECIES: glycoside hydrolase family 65 protein [unclassified Burkholderia]|uniref:glycoside hydrolase family 65 protein n=1 Tax=unclassified Burkholderia TaxID=2613784 RepID=UPI0015C5D7B3|nr:MULTISPECIES: glycoside hydrolase family 65 protein [unclassified Burkholderia]
MTTPTIVTPEANQWSLTSTSYNETYVNQPFIGNGYMGLRIPSAGNGYWVGKQAPDESSPWPLGTPRYTSAMVAGYVGKNAILSTLPNWSPLTIGDSKYVYDPQTIQGSKLSNYSQSTDMKNGLVTTSLIWTSPSGNQAKLAWTMFAHRRYAHLGVVRLDITPVKWSGPMHVDSYVDLRSIRRGTEMTRQRWQDITNNGAEASVIADSTNTKATVAFRVLPPSGLPGSTALSNNNQSGLSWSFTPTLNKTYTFVKYVGIASGADYDLPDPSVALDNTSQQINQLARNVSISAQTGTYGSYNTILQAHEAAWQSIWQSDVIVDDQHSNLQGAIHAAEYMLYSNLREGARNSIAPAGLTSDNYGGMIFWDAETWMYPYLLAAHPEMAKSIVDYRYDRLPNALLNVQNDRSDTGVGSATIGSFFPWTSGTGILSTDGGESAEIHLQADIALAQFQYYEATGDKTWLQHYGWPVLSAIADYYSTRMTLNSNGTYSLTKVDGPDEYVHNATDAAYTNGSALQAINFATQAATILGYAIHPQWAVASAKLVKPQVDPTRQVVLQHAKFNPNVSHTLKQADVVLLTYPMEYPLPTQIGINNLNYYSAITDPTGPAMTNSVQAVIAAQYGLSSLDTFFSNSYQPYIRGPYLNFNETSLLVPSAGQLNPAYTFLTGAGGFMQTLLNGLAGYRFRTDGIYLSPILPVGPLDQVDKAKLTRVYLKGMHWQGRTYDIEVKPDNTTILITNGPAASVMTPDGTFTANSGAPLVIKTRGLTPSNS